MENKKIKARKKSRSALNSSICGNSTSLSRSLSAKEEKQNPLNSSKKAFKREALQTALLNWYQKNKRDLPWRKTSDPYKIWLSEIMLQQTQVKTVIDYYHRFLTRFPTIEALAKAKEEEVLALWSGLGYYSRAQNLHKASKKIVEDYNGRFPSNTEQILSLPGIGKYTLGAIASIAFQQPLPLVDGNVFRVYSRIFAIAGNPKDSKFQKKIWEIAEKLIPPINPGDFNQALMELGATICTPQKPFCLLCPVQKECKARLLHPEKFPGKKERKKTKELYRLVAVLLREGRVYLTLPEQARWHKRLWQLPGVFVEEKKDFENEIKLYLEKENIRFHSLTVLSTHTHHITHHKITVYPYLTELDSIFKKSRKSQWIRIDQLSEIAIPAADRKILESLKVSS